MESEDIKKQTCMIVKCLFDEDGAVQGRDLIESDSISGKSIPCFNGWLHFNLAITNTIVVHFWSTRTFRTLFCTRKYIVCIFRIDYYNYFFA